MLRLLAVPENRVQFLAIDVELVLLVQICFVGVKMFANAPYGLNVRVETGDVNDRVIEHERAELDATPLNVIGLMEQQSEMHDGYSQRNQEGLN